MIENIDKNNKIQDLPGEIWVDVQNYEGIYRVSNLGRVKSLSRKWRNQENLLNPHLNGQYLAVVFSKNNKRKSILLHRLIAVHFIPNPKSLPFVHHIDHNKLNNKIENLAWTTPKENTNLAIAAGKRTQKPKKSKIIKKYIQRTIPKYYTDKDFNPSDEIWIKIQNYENYYEISSYGRVRSIPRVVKFGNNIRTTESKLLKPTSCRNKTNYGYFRYTLSKLGKTQTILSHRLVACHFLENPNNYPVVNHKNSDITNNSITNLEWSTQKNNVEHGKKFGNNKRFGENTPFSKVTEKKVLEIRKLHLEGNSIGKLSKTYDMTRTGISLIVNRKTWKHLP